MIKYTTETVYTPMKAFKGFIVVVEDTVNKIRVEVPQVFPNLWAAENYIKEKRKAKEGKGS